jgi:hypothetical protein
MSATKKMVDSFGRSKEENRARAEIMERANEEARKSWKDPQYRADFAADLTESILEGFEYTTLVDQWIETERTDFNGRVFVRETRGLKAFWMARGGYIEASELTSEVSEMPRDMIGVHVSDMEDKFLTNFAESAQNLRDWSIIRMDAEVNRRVREVLAEAVPNTSPYYATAAGISKTTLDAAIRRVRDESKTGEVVVVGRPTVTDQIMDFNGFSNETQEEIRQKGMLGVYRGARILSLKNYKDEEGAAFFPANELWVMARDAGKFCFYGGLQSKEFSELDNWYWHYLARRDAGVLIHHPERTHRIVDSSIGA